ncbi:hypothetical protein MANI_020298 [Metarhizium anisopliae]|nr:hypothetical protein MANI_020298 [Metarhizium anisopliae]
MEMTWRHFVDPNGEFDELDVAKDALSRISSVAADVGARQKLPVAGCLAAKLCIAKKTLDSADAGQLLRVQRRLPKLIEDLERWADPPEAKRSVLPSVVRPKSYRSFQDAEDRARIGMAAFLRGPSFIRDQYFKKLDLFSRAVMVVGFEETDETKENVARDAEEYPAHINLSLYSVLKAHSTMKLVLAYIISKSFWQFYDSPWMDAKWTSDCIHFLPESAPNDEAATQDGMLYASKPYLAVDFDAKSREIVEYCDSYAVIYRYPRLLALCIILLEIGRGATLMLQDYGSMEANLNATWTLANRLTDRKQSWGDFDYPDYRRAVANCLDGKLLKQNYRTDAVQPEMDTLTRRTVIYNTIVQPLKKLLERVGFLDTLNTLDPIDSKGPEPAFSIPAAPAFPARSQGDGPSSSRQWLEHFPSINRYIRDLTRSNPAGRPVRITILDTGFDNEAVFFRNPARRQRIKGWKDWVDLSDSPLDDNGHGTHTVALVMKVSPQADIYVARIARDRNSLRDCVESIVEAIHWAATTCQTDIITMSFGFSDEILAITKAICEAELHRDNKLLFFAAASNSGGNGYEMFPASHDSVIAIRETNSKGAFSDTNPPVNPLGPAVLGTLGKDVPSAWLSNLDGEAPKSGSSVATAIAAGIAGMCLTLAGAGLHSPNVNLPRRAGKLWTRRGMKALLMKMSQDMGNRCYFISPMRFFSGLDEASIWNALADACVR